jgi:hypothetical protein
MPRTIPAATVGLAMDATCDHVSGTPDHGLAVCCGFNTLSCSQRGLEMETASPRLKARIAGLLYLVTIGTGMAGVLVSSALVVRGDAGATAANLIASEPLYRLSFVGEFIGTAAYVAITALLYELLAPVSRTVSRLAAFFSLAGCAVGVANSINALAPLVLLSGASYLGAFTPDQLHALALAALRLHGLGYNIAMACFACYCLILGWLVFKSGYLPRFIGVLLVLAGLGWTTGSLAGLLSPPVAAQLSPYVMIPGLIGESALALWLTIVGLNPAKWQGGA